MSLEHKNHYVYIYLDTRKEGRWNLSYKERDFEFRHKPFYVGIGTGDRIKQHLIPSERKSTIIKANIINKIINNGLYPIYEKLFIDLSKDESEEIEKAIIKQFGRIDKGSGILANMTDGGRGTVRKTTPKSHHISSTNKFTKRSKRVDQFDKNANFIKKWDCVTDIEKSLGYFASRICACCFGKIKSYKGFIWKFDGTSPYIDNRAKRTTQNRLRPFLFTPKMGNLFRLSKQPDHLPKH
jgi:hypothetical protein